MKYAQTYLAFARPRLALVGVLALLAAGCSSGGRSQNSASRAIMDGGKVNPEKMAAALMEARANGRVQPGEPYWPYRIGELYTAADSTDKAIANLQAALEVDPGYAPAAALLSKLFYDRGNFNSAIVLLDDYLANNQDAPDALRAALALHLEALGDVDRANLVLASCTEGSHEVRSTRAYLTLRGDDPTSGLKDAEQALQTNGKSAVNHNNYGIALLFSGKPHEARKSFLRALDLDEHLAGALYNMAIVETFYFFNEEAGRTWFTRYQQYSNDDPDDLATALGINVGAIHSEDN